MRDEQDFDENEFELNKEENDLDFTKKELDELLKSAKLKIVKKKWARGSYNMVQLLYNGKYIEVCRADLCNQCPTGIIPNTLNIKEIRKELKEKNWYGGRFLDDGALAIIDSVTDG